MHLLICYDVATTTKEGRRRLRQVARACLNYGQRVQFSVFECVVGEKEWAHLRHRLLQVIDTDEDSVRFYFLCRQDVARIEHHGLKKHRDLREPLIV